MRKRYYIIFVAREEDGKLRKIPIPMRYAYVFVAAAVVGAFTITGMAGSYSRMLLKTAHYNQVRSEREAIRKDYLEMEKVAHEKDVQAASLGSLASQVSALYGLTHSKVTGAKAVSSSPAMPSTPDEDLDEQSYHQSLDQFYALRATALSGHIWHSPGLRLDGLSGSFGWLGTADAPSLWPVEGRVTSSFGEREDPFNGEGAFHTGIDISAPYGEAIRAAGDGFVTAAGRANGYGREVIIDHGHGISTLYGHMSGFAVTAGDQVKRGQIIGYVGSSGRSTGAHVHYEVRIQNTPVNPHKYLRTTMEQFSTASAGPVDTLRGGGS